MERKASIPVMGKADPRKTTVIQLLREARHLQLKEDGLQPH